MSATILCGKVKKATFSDCDYALQEARCPLCFGEGKSNDAKCGGCGGTGIRPGFSITIEVRQNND